MNINAIIVGYGKLKEYTLPLVASIQKTNPDMDIVVVDNNSPEPYPDIEGATVIRNTSNVLSSGLNFGIRHQQADWYVLLNNDIIFHKPVVKRIEALSPDNIYGFFINPVGGPRSNNLPWAWLSNWAMILPDKVWQAVGEWDEHFAPMWGEDMDYSKRVQDAGFGLEFCDRNDWGIIHLMEPTRKQERLHFLKNKAHIEAMLEYVRAKHGY